MNGPSGVGSGYATNFGCDNACHFNDTGHRLPNASGLTVEFGNYGSGNAACDTCHGYPPDGNPDLTGATPVNHLFGDLGATLRTNHNDCLLCHGNRDDGTGAYSPSANYSVAADHNTGSINMNSTTQYNDTDFGCDAACHPNDAAHRLTDSALPVVLADYGGAGGAGSCAACHDTGVGDAPVVVQNVSSHASLTCEECHTAHGQGTVEIPNNAAVGINYTANGEGGIALGGTATSGTTEAEICWNCHNNNGVSEWGTNTDTNGGSPDYDFGTLNQSNWVGAVWSSAQNGTGGKPDFSYKSGLIQSTHSANPAASVAGINAVASIRCTYCHDVHNVGAQGFRKGFDNSGSPPYLCGTWMGNPYREDGAPLSTITYNATTDDFGAVPRGTTARTELGGYQIDQNNSNPTSGWTANASAGLCEFCHGNGDGSWTASEIDNLNQFGTAGPSTAWIGTNGHSNAVLGGSGALRDNIFRNSDRSASAIVSGQDGAGNPTMAYRHAVGDRSYGFRSTTITDGAGWFLNPRVTNNTVGRPYAFDDYNWGATVDEATTDIQYHRFSCSKCHNPHASRLPRLMITNCLDTKHSTWDDPRPGIDAIPPAGTPNSGSVASTAVVSVDNGGVTFSNATSAQNCHRVRDPAFGKTAIPTGGWNRVTPWNASGQDNPGIQ